MLGNENNLKIETMALRNKELRMRTFNQLREQDGRFLMKRSDDVIVIKTPVYSAAGLPV